jgi:nucleoside-diphosphate-sugar epimerase
MRRRDLTYVEDMASTIVQMLFCKTAIGRVFNIGSGIAITINDIIKLLCYELNKPISGVKIIEEAGTVGDSFSNVADITQAKKILNFKPKFGLEAGFKELIAQRMISSGKAADFK